VWCTRPSSRALRMPELPEVETVRRAIAPVLEGRRFERVEINDPRLTRPEDPLAVAAELVGERVVHVDRRGKYLILRFASGRSLLIHLRMTGSLLREPAASTHVRAVVGLDDGTEVGYRDVRRFGTWLLLEPGELEPYLGARVGGEPLVAAFTARGLGERLEGRRAPLKSALLDQRTLAGLGNIYVDEARSNGTSCGGCTARSGRRWSSASAARARRSPTTGCRTARPGRCSTSSAPTVAPASRATVAARRSRRRRSQAGGRGSARAASRPSQPSNSLLRGGSAQQRSASGA
jgi:hypothetical protein